MTLYVEGEEIVLKDIPNRLYFENWDRHFIADCIIVLNAIKDIPLNGMDVQDHEHMREALYYLNLRLEELGE